MSTLPDKAKFAVINKFGGPEVLEIVEHALPEIKPNQILIKVHAASINPIDWKQRKGNHKLILGSPFPITLGYDVSGTVVKIGIKIRKFKKGDKVFGVLNNKYGGAYGEYAKGMEHCFTHIPEGFNMLNAAAYPMAALTAFQTFKKINLNPDQTVLINGASGGVGHFAIQIAKLKKLKVTAVASGKSASFVSEHKPDKFIDYTQQDILSIDEKFDLFYDAIGIYSFKKTKHLLKNNGTYLNLNYLNSLKQMPLNRIRQIFTNGKKADTLLMKHMPEDLEIIKNWMAERKLKAHIDEFFKLEEIREAHKYAQNGHTKGKNIIIMPE